MSHRKDAISGTISIGSAQLINAALSVVRTKAVAVVLGPEGIGLIGYWTSTKNLMSAVGSMGLGIAGVREIGGAQGEEQKTAQLNLRLYGAALAILTCVLTILFSPVLDELTGLEFMNAAAFAFLGFCASLSILFSAFSVELRAMGDIRQVALVTIITSIVATIITLLAAFTRPELLKYTALLLPALTPAILAAYFVVRRSGWLPTELDRLSVLPYFISFFRIGFPVMATAIVGLATALAIRSHVVFVGGLELLGLYVAIAMISERLFEVLTKTLTTEYYPRLTRTLMLKNNRETANLIDTQVDLTSKTGVVLIAALGLFSTQILTFLFSDDFLSAMLALQVYIIADMFRIYGFPVGFVTMSAGRTGVSFFKETFIQLVFLAMIYVFVETDPLVIAFCYLAMRALNYCLDAGLAFWLIGYRPQMAHVAELLVILSIFLSASLVLGTQSSIGFGLYLSVMLYSLVRAFSFFKGPRY